MAVLTVLPDNAQFDSLPGETILAATLRQGIPHVHACGGKGHCSTCRVQVLDGLDHFPPRNALEQSLATRLRLPSNMRLACQTIVEEGAVQVRRPVIDELDIRLTNVAQQYPDQRLGEEVQRAVLFSDIEDYTVFAETVPAYDVIHVLNRYFEEMSAVVYAHRGRVSDFIGDGLMAVFGMEHAATAAADAVAAALAMLAAMKQLNPYLEYMYGRRFRVRIGIHYGDVVVGHIGGPAMRKLATIGDTVNVAARIEAANKTFGTSVLVSQAVVDELADCQLVRRGFLAPLKGKQGVHRLYEIGPDTV